MGAISCCSNNQLCDYSNSNDEVELYTPAKSKDTRKNLQRISSINLDKEKFILTKKRNLLDEYEIIKRIGEGAYGSVFKAKSRTTREEVAIKCLKKNSLNNEAFLNEISLLRRLDHPNVIRVVECIDDNNCFYLVEEYCSGGDLYDYIKKQKRFTEHKAAIIMKQLLMVTNYMHIKQIVHRDLKPENIVLSTNSKDETFIKIIDFGTSIKFTTDKMTQELGTVAA